MLTSTRPSCRTSTWSSQVVRITSTSTSGCAAVKARTAGVTVMPGMKPTVKVLDPAAAWATRRRTASAEASSGRASSSNWRPAGVSSVARLVADEQLGAELVLQRADLPGQHRLGDVQPLGRPAEVQFLGDGDEVPELAEVDVHNTFRVLQPPEQVLDAGCGAAHGGRRIPHHERQFHDLQDRRVVVLGGTSGIGLATARLAAARGATVIVASSNPNSMKRALETLPDSAAGEALDLTDAAAVAAFFDRLDPFDHLAFTAGEPLTLLEVGSMDLAEAHKAFELRYFGALGAVSAAASKIRPGGSVVLTTGAAGDRPSPAGRWRPASVARSTPSSAHSPWSWHRCASTRSSPAWSARHCGRTWP